MMAAGSAEGGGRSNGGGGYATTGVKPERERPATTTHAGAAPTHARAYDYALTYAHARAYVSLAMKASGLLALLLSTVILLGGYVQSLGTKDFFCITVISAIQAAGIFKHWENNVQYLMDFIGTTNVLLDKLIILTTNFSVKGFFIACLSILVSPFLAVALCIQLIYLLGPFACAAVSSLRMAKLNHGRRDGTDNMANMMAALNIFYSLIIFQGAMFGVLLLTIGIGRRVVASHLHALEQLPEEWGKEAIHRYLYHISAKCRKDPLSVKGTDMIKYAAELVDSESQQDYLHGARLLSAFINKGEDVRWLLLPSTRRIQKLVDSLWISSSSESQDDNTEIRELAAMIVAGLAAHIDVARYPGALRYISSLLQEETIQTHWNISKQAASDLQRLGPLEILRQPKEEQMKNLNRREEECQWRLMRDQKRLGTSQERRRKNSEERSTSNELILLGLTILEKLASNSDNRRLICSTPGLLAKITTPLYSGTLIQGVKTKAWADIVTRCLKVLYQLIRTPAPAGWTSRMLRHQISSDDQALSNLKSILEVGNNEGDHQELQLVAMKILTELALDLSINLTEETKKVLVTKQLQLFLLPNGENGEESAATAGRTLVSLSTNSESNSTLIKATQDDIIGCLTGILDDENITRSAMAAQIIVNLCAHCNVDNMKEILRKVLREIMSIKRKSQQRKISEGQNNPASGDEENQGKNSVSTNNEEGQNISTDGDHTKTEEISDQQRDKQEAFLSLAQVICDKLDSGDLDSAIQSAVDQNNTKSEEQRREAFVDKLKTIIDDNHHPTPDCLRIVKLCGRIAESTLRSQQYAKHFRNKGFESSLSEASKTMSELESCMLFVGTDFGHKKTVRPLFSDIEKSFDQI